MASFIRKLIPVWLAEPLRLAKAEIELRLYRPIMVDQVFGKVRLKVKLADPLARSWYEMGGEELAEVELLKSGRLKPGALVFNIGAHHGIVALQLADAVSPGGRVIAVESNPRSARVAAENAALNPQYAVTVEAKAIASKPGEIRCSDAWHAQHIGSGGVTVPATTIDELAAIYGEPDVIYLDVEGFECEALAGATSVLLGRPSLYIEVHVGFGLEAHGGSLERLLSLLPKTGYRLQAHRSGVPGAAEETVVDFSPEIEWLQGRFGLLATSIEGL